MGKNQVFISGKTPYIQIINFTENKKDYCYIVLLPIIIMCSQKSTQHLQGSKNI